jgi:cytoskeleton protein RodZ
VAERLKLLPRQIESLEHERFDRLPGPAIARGMVRNYARLLELDPEPLLERMAPRGEEAPERGQSAGRHGEQLPSSSPTRRSTLLYVGFSVAVLALIGAFAYVWQRQEKAAPEFVAPDRTAAATEAPRALPQAPPTTVQKPLEKAAESEKSQAAKAPDEPKPPEAAAQPALPPGVHRLVLRMEEEAWLEVRDGTGRSLVSSLNPAGTERAVRGRPPFELVIGNAAHVKLTYDGHPVDLKPHIRGDVARLTLK